MNDKSESFWRALAEPTVFIALIIIFGIFALIGLAMFGLDHGVLLQMGAVNFARGLITYLFAVVTIGTAVVLVVSALSGTSTEESKEKFQRGKEILSLLLGVFGTIVGFYFGSETSGLGRGEREALRLSPLLLSAPHATSGQPVSISALVSGGGTPYKYRLDLGGKSVADQQPVSQTGVITREIVMPETSSEMVSDVTLTVTDTFGHALSVSGGVKVSPAAGSAGEKGK